MSQHKPNEHYEDRFEFPLLKLIRQRAEEKDISYLAAADEVVPEYARALRFRDAEYNEELFKEQQKQLEELRKAQSLENKKGKEG